MGITKLDTQFYKMALQAIGFNVDDITVELMVNMVRLVDETGGDITLKDIFLRKFEVYGINGIELNNKGEVIEKTDA